VDESARGKTEITMKNLIAAILFLAGGLPAQNTFSPWKPLDFLIGAWEAKTIGGSAGAASSGTYTFQTELKGHVLARHSTNSGCKGPTDFDCLHGDLLYVYQDAPGQSYKAIYFDNEGHVIHYEMSTPAPATVVFHSEQYRLSYELKGATMYGKFQIRMPGKTEFTTYLEWSGKKK
jgi:hypothetical protein